MYELIVAMTILMGIGVGWSIGANDAANSLGTAVGARVITLRQAILLIAVFGLTGALLQGGYVCKTIGNGIVKLSELEGSLAAQVALVSTFAACIWVVAATYLKMPVSTSHSIVGAVAGAGVALGVPVAWIKLRDIFMCWVLTPVGAAVLGNLLFRFLDFVFPRLVPKKDTRKELTVLIVLSGCYVAYSWGANDVANATGVLLGGGVLDMPSSVAIGGLAIILGVVTWGYRVIETIGSQITHLLPMMAFAAQLASAINVHLYTLWGIPVSTSHSIVGAICGVGLVKGVRVVNVRIMREIAVCWVATPFVSGILSFVAMKVLRVFAPA